MSVNFIIFLSFYNLMHEDVLKESILLSKIYSITIFFLQSNAQRESKKTIQTKPVRGQLLYKLYYIWDNDKKMHPSRFVCRNLLRIFFHCR